MKLVDEDGEKPKGVRFILLLSDHEDMVDAAKTRECEIKKNYPTDKIVFINLCYFDKLKQRIESEVSKAKAEGYSETKELAVFSHCGGDGPISGFSENYKGDLRLSNSTGSFIDRNQMTIEGWASINYNFDANNSIASFYGCQSASFAEKF